jgi:hypothetical protein
MRRELHFRAFLGFHRSRGGGPSTDGRDAGSAV